eukprot:352648-Chlamydomonas_euryale.AAC.4
MGRGREREEARERARELLSRGRAATCTVSTNLANRAAPYPSGSHLGSWSAAAGHVCRVGLQLRLPHGRMIKCRAACAQTAEREATEECGHLPRGLAVKGTVLTR